MSEGDAISTARIRFLLHNDTPDRPERDRRQRGRHNFSGVRLEVVGLGGRTIPTGLRLPAQGWRVSAYLGSACSIDGKPQRGFGEHWNHRVA